MTNRYNRKSVKKSQPDPLRQRAHNLEETMQRHTTSSASVYRNTSWRPSRKQKIPIFLGLGLCIFLGFLALSPSSRGQANTHKLHVHKTATQTRRSTATTSPDIIDTDADVIPLCEKSDANFGGSLSFDCTSQSTTIHYEYLSTTDEALTIASQYGLENTKQTPQYIRSGIVSGRTRLMALDASTYLVVNITSDMDEKTLRTWWNDYEKHLSEKVETSDTTTSSTLPLNEGN